MKSPASSYIHEKYNLNFDEAVKNSKFVPTKSYKIAHGRSCQSIIVSLLDSGVIQVHSSGNGEELFKGHFHPDVEKGKKIIGFATPIVTDDPFISFLMDDGLVYVANFTISEFVKSKTSTSGVTKDPSSVEIVPDKQAKFQISGVDILNITEILSEKRKSGECGPVDESTKYHLIEIY